ncbi:31930_t:CDS:2, partial [Gigaspora margarita]
GAQATSHVELINSHIKAIICREHITLCELFNSLNSLIAGQDYYYDFISWKSSNPNVKPPNICDTMYMNVDAILKAFVVPNIIEKFMQDDDTIFVNDAFDYLLAHSFSIYKQAKNKIVEIWELHNEYQDKDLSAQLLVNLSTVFLSKLAEESLISTTILRTNDCANLFLIAGEISSTAHPSPIIAKKLIQKKRTYAETIGIVCKAINIAIEKDDSYVLKFLKEYIVQNDHSLVENTVSASSSSQRTNTFIECSEPNIISKLLPVKDTNPVKKTRRDRPPKSARYQLALESQKSKSQKKVPKSVCSPGTNTCGECSGKGHNRRWHLKHENKAYDFSIICEFCGGNGHRKELHNNGSIETNELDQVSSDESE